MSARGRLGHLLRRMGAALYDAILLLALWFAGATLVTVSAGEAVSADNIWFKLFLWGLAGAFCLWFWLHGGQTLGLRAWRLRVVDAGTGGATPWPRALLRYALAAPAWISVIGILWSLVDSQQRALHERLSGTRLQLLPKS